MSRSGKVLSDFFFPDLTCPVCGEYSQGLCAGCRSSFVRYDRELIWESQEGVSLYRYQGNTISLISRYKKKSRFSALEAIVALVIREYGDDIRKFDLLTFAPSSASSKKKLGFDHGKLLAKRISKATGVRCIFLFLPPDKEQKVLDKGERMNNALGITLRKGIKGELQGKKVLIIDDVYTTGSTVMRCMEIISSNGGEPRYLTLSRL